MNFGMNKGQQQSQAYSGFRGTEQEAGARGQGYYSGSQLTNLSDQILKNPLRPMGFGVNELGLNPGRYGLGSNTDMAMDELGKQMFAGASASGAYRGQNTPEAYSNVVGSAITRALPKVIPYTQNWQQAMYRAPMEFGQYLTGTALAPADYWSRSLGAQSNASGSNFGFNFGVAANSASSDPSSGFRSGGGIMAPFV